MISQTLVFTATVNNDVASAGVTWSTTGGTLTGQTLTSATFSSTTAGSFTITAKSNADTTQSASATIGVTDLAGVATYHNNLLRNGTNTHEFALTPLTVTSSTFGKLFSCAVDGNVYTQTLWMPNLTIGGGKGANFLGRMYVINRDPGMMGQLATPDKSVQQWDLNGMIFATAAFWQNTLYIAAVGQPLAAYTLNPGTSMFNTTAAWQSAHSYGFPGATPSVSSQGTTQGIVWAIDTNSTSASGAAGADGPAVLFAYDPQNGGALLYSSDTTSGAANAAGNAVKFAVPAVANGKVYWGTQTELDVFGLLP